MKKYILLLTTIFAYNLCNASLPVQATTINTDATQRFHNLKFKKIIFKLRKAHEKRNTLMYSATYRNLCGKISNQKSSQKEITSITNEVMIKNANSEEIEFIKKVTSLDKEIQSLIQQIDPTLIPNSVGSILNKSTNLRIT